MPHRKMSKEEHDETVATISTGVAYIIKMGKILIPVIVGMFCFIVWIGVKAISINEWNKSLVKQGQMSRHELREMKIDSILNAKIDTLDKNKIGYKDLSVQAANDKRANRTNLKGVTAIKNEDGTFTYSGVY